MPATATLIGLIALGQAPTVRDLAIIALVTLGVGLHRDVPIAGRNPAAANRGTGPIA